MAVGIWIGKTGCCVAMRAASVLSVPMVVVKSAANPMKANCRQPFPNQRMRFGPHHRLPLMPGTRYLMKMSNRPRRSQLTATKSGRSESFAVMRRALGSLARMAAAKSAACRLRGAHEHRTSNYQYGTPSAINSLTIQLRFKERSDILIMHWVLDVRCSAFFQIPVTGSGCSAGRISWLYKRICGLLF